MRSPQAARDRVNKKLCSTVFSSRFPAYVTDGPGRIQLHERKYRSALSSDGRDALPRISRQDLHLHPRHGRPSDHHPVLHCHLRQYHSPGTNILLLERLEKQERRQEEGPLWKQQEEAVKGRGIEAEAKAEAKAASECVDAGVLMLRRWFPLCCR